MAPKSTKKASTEGKAKADKPKTKRTPPYIIFCTEKRPELRAAHPNASFGEMGKMLGQMWAQMDEKAKAVSTHPSNQLINVRVTLCFDLGLCQRIRHQKGCR